MAARRLLLCVGSCARRCCDEDRSYRLLHAGISLAERDARISRLLMRVAFMVDLSSVGYRRETLAAEGIHSSRPVTGDATPTVGLS